MLSCSLTVISTESAKLYCKLSIYNYTYIFAIHSYICSLKNEYYEKMKDKLKKPELLAPAGDWRMLVTAVENGADAVYFGVDKLNMRQKAKNFSVDELPEIVKYCEENTVKAHLTVNTIVYEDELADLDLIIPKAKEAGVEYVICWDMAVIEKCRQYDMPFCISTQASISNSNAANMYKSLGASRIVLARECTLEQIKEIRQGTDLEIEAFVHGAMCVAVSGRCFMSHYTFGKSANRGECIQPCRREYEIYDTDGQSSFRLGKDYVMSPKDLSTIEFIDELIEAGINSFKIEGRKRSPEYIAKVVSVYRKAFDLHFDGNLNIDLKKKFVEELRKVYNRGFSTGFYFGKPTEFDFADKYGSKATTKKIYLGKVVNYFKKSGIAHVRLEAGDLNLKDKVYFIGNTTGVYEKEIDSIVRDEEFIEHANKGDEVTLKIDKLVRPRDQVFKIVNVREKIER